MVPLLFKIFKSLFCCLKGGSMIDLLHVSCKFLFVFPYHIPQGVTDLVYNAELGVSQWENPLDGLGKATQVISAGNQDIFYATSLQIS